MLNALKSVVRSLGIDTRKVYQTVSARSVDAAVREQGLAELRARLREQIPDLADQYTMGIDPIEYARYWETKMRSIHAFQIDSALQAMESLGGDHLTVVDVGDSSGNHGAYLKALAPPGRIDRMVSVNLDPVAVDKIKAKGGEAILCRAEALDTQGLQPDLMLLFETLEHITDPLRFLHTMAADGNIENILLTVPYRVNSRFGGDLIRRAAASMPDEITPEQVHIFELSPEDWQLLARLAGYRTEFCKIYRQYPRRSICRLMRPLWRRLDFEGFISLSLKRDDALSGRYTGW
jgi:hypothetical protein